MKLSSLLLATMLISGSAFAIESEPTQVSVGESAVMEINNDEFLGCVESRRACRHEAEHHGYHHSRAIRDHHACHDHHEPYACYGIE